MQFSRPCLFPSRTPIISSPQDLVLSHPKFCDVSWSDRDQWAFKLSKLISDSASYLLVHSSKSVILHILRMEDYREVAMTD